MSVCPVRLLLVSALALGLALTASPSSAREIALSFDDAPSPDSAAMTGKERGRRLTAALRAAGVEQAVFFAVTRGRTPAELVRLQRYAQSGHLVANHSDRHRSLRDMPAAAFVADIAAADAILRALPGFRPWFRFPFLAEGQTRDKRDAVRRALGAMGYRQGYVTVDNYDWYLDHLATEARREGQRLDEAALRSLYVETIVQACEFYDAIARRALGRSPRHVLLLHENDLAAWHVGHLVEALRARGWTVIPAEQAYDDPISRIEPDSLFLGQGRVAALAHAQGMQPAELVHEREDEAVLARLFAERVLARGR